MRATEFSLVYDGPALREHSIDVRTLAPALLSFAELFEEANRVVNGGKLRFNVNIRATTPGSFECLLELTNGGFIDCVKDLLISDEVNALLNFRDIVLFGSGAAGVSYGFIQLVKWLRGRKPVAKRLDVERVRIELDDQVIEIPFAVLQLYRDVQVREAARRALAPLEQEGIDELRIEGGQGQTESIYKNQISDFDIPDEGDEPLHEQRLAMTLSIVSLAFKEDNKWRLSDGSNQFSATISDPDFLYKVNNSYAAFSKGDLLECEVMLRQAQGRKGLRTEYEIVRVKEHRSGARQLPLDFQD